MVVLKAIVLSPSICTINVFFHISFLRQLRTRKIVLRTSEDSHKSVFDFDFEGRQRFQRTFKSALPDCLNYLVRLWRKLFRGFCHHFWLQVNLQKDSFPTGGAGHFGDWGYFQERRSTPQMKPALDPWLPSQLRFSLVQSVWFVVISQLSKLKMRPGGSSHDSVGLSVMRRPRAVFPFSVSEGHRTSARLITSVQRACRSRRKPAELQKKMPPMNNQNSRKEMFLLLFFLI